jgi:membrane protease YdiL (CAAX protease family)
VVVSEAEPRIGPGRLAGWLGFVLVFAALGYGARFTDAGEETEDRDVFYSWDFAAFGVVQAAIFVGIVLLVTMGLPRRELLGLRAPASWGRALASMGAVFGITLVVSFVVGLFLDPAGEQGLIPDEWDSSRLAPFVANALLVCLLVPIVEELMFRGAGCGLTIQFGLWPAVIAVGVLFGLAHGLVEAFPVLATFGAGLAWLRFRTGSLYPCIILHSVFNSIAIAVSVGSAIGD